MRQSASNSKYKTFTTAAFCLFSSSALVAAQNPSPSFTRLKELASSTNLGLDYVPFTSEGEYLISLSRDAAAKLQEDTIYAQIYSETTLDGTKRYSLEQTGTYLAMALDQSMQVTIYDRDTNDKISRKLNWLSNYDESMEENKKRRKQVKSIMNHMLDLQNQAQAMGIDIDDCKMLNPNYESSLQNSLACVLQGNNTAVYKRSALRTVPSLIKSYAVGLDHLMIQLGLMDLLAPVHAADATSVSNAVSSKDVFVTLAASINAIRDKMSTTPLLQAQYAFLVSKAPLYIAQAGNLDTVDRIRRFLPEIARGLALVTMNKNSEAYKAAFDLTNAKFAIVEKNIVESILAKTNKSAKQFIGKYQNPPKIDPADPATQFWLFDAVVAQSLIRFLNETLKSPIDHYTTANKIEPTQQVHFGKFLPQAKIIATQISENSKLIESLLWLVRISEDQNFVAKIRDLMDHTMYTSENTADARRSIVSLEWLIANKQYVFAELVKLKPSIAMQAANTKLLTSILYKQNKGIIGALFEAEGGSVEDRVSLRGSKP